MKSHLIDSPSQFSLVHVKSGGNKSHPQEDPLMSVDPARAQESEYFTAYADHARTLRTWFVAYGVGGPVVLISSDTAWKTLVDSGCSDHISLLFIIGGALQIVTALLNKHAMWNLYFGEYQQNNPNHQGPKHKDSKIYNLHYWYSEQNWTDEIVDIFTLAFFGLATYIPSRVLSNPPGTLICKRETEVFELALLLGLLVLVLVARLLWALLWRPNKVDSSAPPPQ
jgi:hypothetical protein